MKKLLVLFISLTLLVTVFSGFSVVGARSEEVLKNKNKAVTITGEITKVNPGMPFKNELLALKTKENIYILSGKTGGLEKYIGLSTSIKGYAYRGPQGIQFFYVKAHKISKESKPLPVSTPTPDVAPATPVSLLSPKVVPITPVPKYTVLKGYLNNIDPDKPRFLLKTERTVYELMGSTKGMENDAEKLIEVTGDYVYTLLPTEYPLFSVISYRVIEEARPTPTPTQTPTSEPGAIVITEKDNAGYVYVKKGDEVKLMLESNPSTGFKWNFDEKPDENILLVTGYEYIPDSNDEIIDGAGGKEVWTFKAVNTGTAVMYLSYSRPWESVPSAKNFKVKVIVEEVPQPVYEVYQGILTVTKIEPLPNIKLASPYKFELKTEKYPFVLQGNTKGLENYDGQKIEVTGTVSPLTIYPPIFNVVSYKVIVTPEPTPTMSSKVHTVISDKAIYLSDPSASSFQNATGCTTISWYENTGKAFFNSKVTVGEGDKKATYEFELNEVKTSDMYSIVGTFNIKKNGEYVAKEIPGKVYGIDQPVGEYFKFYSEGEKWHVSGYITSRIDF